MNRRLICSPLVFQQTLTWLQEAGRAGNERVVLWLAPPDPHQLTISEVFLPQQKAARDIFRIPKDGMSELMGRIRRNRLMVAAQVHSHPHEAFHSAADDAWAIVRHVGAISIVIPKFGLQTPPHRFLHDAAIFRYSASGSWQLVPAQQISSVIKAL